MQDIAQEVMDLIVDDATPETPISATSTLVEGVGYDSLGIVGLAVALEERFDIEMSDDTIESWKTVGDVILSVGILLDRKGN